MEAKTPQPNELASKLKYVAPTILRATVEGVDYVFVPGQDYENLPANHYLFSLWKQGYFEEVKAVGKSHKKTQTLSN
jgi:hypothetical protein